MTASEQQIETEKKTKRKAPSPPASEPTPKTESGAVYMKPAVVKDLTTSPKVCIAKHLLKSSFISRNYLLNV